MFVNRTIAKRQSAVVKDHKKHHVNSERTYVHDKDGWVEVDPELVWNDLNTYKWVAYDIKDNVMCYYFEFSG